MLSDWPLQTRLLIRRVGTGLIAVGAILTMGVMFLGPGWSRPWILAGALLVAGGGLLSLAVPGYPATLRRRVERPILLMAGVFFTFATIGPLMMMVFLPGTSSPISGLVAAAIAGIIACGWASAFNFRAWWLVPLTICFQIFAPPPIFRAFDSWGLLQNFGALNEQLRRGSLALEAVLCVVIGYILIVRFIRVSEAEQARARAELDMARQIHGALVPDVDVTTPHLHIYGRSIASSEMGGDLIDVIRRGDRTDVFLADVSGHGVRAGVVMAMIKSAIRMRLRTCESLEELLLDLDRVLSDLIEPGMFATLACIRFDGGHATVGLAGHLPVLRVRLGVVEELTNEALPMGLGAEERFIARDAQVQPGDTLILFTDGFTEVQAPGGGLLGLQRFKEIAARHAHMAPKDAARTIIDECRRFGVSGDDQTISLIRVT